MAIIDERESSTSISLQAVEKPDEDMFEHVPKRIIIGDPELNERYGFDERNEEWHKTKRRKLLRKLDLHIMPTIILMYLLNYLDRSNLSQARLGGLEADLHMSGNDFNILTMILFIGYILVQMPSNVLLVRVPPSLYLGSCMVTWGTISAVQGATKNFGGMLACRFFLGAIESPFFPGILALLSSWYTREELAHRIAFFYGGGQMGSMFGGLIAAVVLGNLDGARGIAGWRWLFIIEGVATVFVSLVAIVILPNYPGTTRWLNDEDKAYAQWCLSADIGEVDDNNSIPLKKAVVMVLKDYKVYIFGLMMHANTLTQTFSYFFPTIVETLGYNSTITLLLTVPVWFAAFLFSVGYSYHASITNERTLHIIGAMLIALVGNILVITTTKTGVRYFAMFLMPMGAYPGVQIIIAWIASSIPRPAPKRTIALGMCNMFSNSANIYGSYLYPSSDGPQYIMGGIVISVMAVVCIITTIIMRFCLVWENKKLEMAEQQAQVEADMSGEGDMPQRKQFRQIY